MDPALPIQDWKRLYVKSLNVGSNDSSTQLIIKRFVSPVIPQQGQMTDLVVYYQKVGNFCTLGLLPVNSTRSFTQASSAVEMSVPENLLPADLRAQLIFDTRSLTGTSPGLFALAGPGLAVASNPISIFVHNTGKIELRDQNINNPPDADTVIYSPCITFVAPTDQIL